MKNAFMCEKIESRHFTYAHSSKTSPNRLSLPPGSIFFKNLFPLQKVMGGEETMIFHNR